MKKEGKFMKFVEGVFTFADEHQREIFLGAQIVGTVTTAILCWKAAPKAEKVLADHKEKMKDIDKDDKEGRKKETVETIKDMAPIVLPPVITCATTIGCALGGYKASTKQIAALSAAYALSEKALGEYKDKALELVGPKKAQTIQDEVNIDRMKEAYKGEKDIVKTGRGEVLFYEKYCGIFFRSSWEDIRRGINNINKDFNENRYEGDEVPYSDFLYEVGLNPDSIFAHNYVFKKRENDFAHSGPVDLKTSSSQLETKINPETMESATVIDFWNPPTLAKHLVRR